MKAQKLAYDVCRHYLSDLPSEFPPALKATILGYIRSRNLAGLSSVGDLFDSQSHQVEVKRSLLQIEAFFKKNAAFTDEKVALEAAQRSFLKAEKLCRITNRRLDWYYVRRDRLDPDLDFTITKMERWISKVLGPFDTFLGELPKYVRVTDGATSTRRRADSQAYRKIRRSYSCPSGSIPYIEATARYFSLPVPRCKVSPVNRVEAVPKNWKTHRTIACEPDGALPFQLAFDTYAKLRLRRKTPIDLSDQFRNQELARQGSIGNHLATIDMSMASDTVAYNTVAWLFPEPWFQYLCAHRSRYYKGSFGIGKYAKFSSMGNGATFTIETLVFAAACAALGSKESIVYGDDIIIETDLVPSLLKVLKFFGFVINQDKSHVDGPYRESCGTHWFNGTLVTPFFIRDEYRTKPGLCHMANGLAAVACPGGNLWKFLLTLISEKNLPLVPFNMNSMSGVWIDPHSAYEAKVLRCSRLTKGKLQRFNWIPRFKSFVDKSLSTLICDSRTLILWYHDSFRIIDPGKMSERVRSRISASSHKYVRKWVSWRPPAGQMPVHLYWWSELLTRREAG